MENPFVALRTEPHEITVCRELGPGVLPAQYLSAYLAECQFVLAQPVRQFPEQFIEHRLPPYLSPFPRVAAQPPVRPALLSLRVFMVEGVLWPVARDAGFQGEKTDAPLQNTVSVKDAPAAGPLSGTFPEWD